MKKQTIEINVYECGDLLDVSKVRIRESPRSKKAPGFNAAKKAIVLAKTDNRDGTSNYTILCDNMKIFTLKSREQGEEKYLKHYDEFDKFFAMEGQE